MIPVKPVPKPGTFESKAGKPGRAWLQANPDAARPRDYWTPFLADLGEGFTGRCGYAAMLDPTGGTVDHYLSFKSRPDLAYEWTNLRFASQPLNASKKAADETVLDPYSVSDGWFEILLPSLQMRVTDVVPAAERARAEYTIQRLRLRDGERVIRWRRSWYEMYLAGKLTLEGLEEVAPLIAAAVRKIASVVPAPTSKVPARRKRGKAKKSTRRA
jgi:hypothetical protein